MISDIVSLFGQPKSLKTLKTLKTFILENRKKVTMKLGKSLYEKRCQSIFVSQVGIF